MTTQQTFLDFERQLLVIYDKREADQIADWVFENVTHLKKWERRADNKELSETHLLQLRQHLNELLQHKPVQYVLNEAWFYKMKFYVNEQVLIPRPETEELVEWILEDLEGVHGGALQVMDIGTGSGCISVAVKKNGTGVSVSAVEVSEGALMVARKNAEELDTDIQFQQLDFLDEDQWPALGLYDVIVSNPPYIPSGEREQLSKVVTDWEPSTALFVEEGDPLLFYRKILKFAGTHLKMNGAIYVETHEDYAGRVKELFDQPGFSVRLKRDLYGKERMVRAAREAS